MKIEILDINRLIEVNKLKEVTSKNLMSNKLTFDPEGILSNEIFGISKGDRRGTFAYIDLKRPFIHPHIYTNVLKRIFRNIMYLMAGQKKYIIKDGLLVEDSSGWTGISELYRNWNKIDWSKHPSESKNLVKLLSNATRDQIFIDKILVCPPAYRDVQLAGSVDSSDHVNELNNIYTSIIRLTSNIQKGGLFDKIQFATQSKIQEQICALNIYFQGQISKKKGLIRKYLLGKSVEFGTRSVISAFSYNNETADENMVDVETLAMPISQCCSTFYPFIESWLMNFFTRNVINDPNLISYADPKTGKELHGTVINPEIQFSERVIRKLIHNYVFNPDNRFKIISVNIMINETKEKRECALILKGKQSVDGQQEPLTRPLTITDLLYLAAVDACEKRHVMVTRYPIGTDKGLFFNKIKVQSTRNHVKITFNGIDYPFYPHIDFDIPHHKIGVEFIDSLVYSNSLLKEMGADYDGDQVTVKGIWTDEANHEAEKIMSSKITALNINGNNSKSVANEVVNSFYELTKIMNDGKKVHPDYQNKYLSMKPNEFTRSVLVGMLAYTTDATNKNEVKRKPPRHRTWDTIDVPANHFYDGHPAMELTIGRYLFNKYILQGAGIISVSGIDNNLINGKGLESIDNRVGHLLLHDRINRKQFNRYVNLRDNLGYWLNGMLAHSLSEKMLTPLKEIELLKKQLLEKHKDEIEKGNIDVMTDISNQLIDRAREILKDDPGMDLYLSGDLNFDNNYRSNAIIKGPVLNKITNQFDFVSSSFMNGIDVKDIPAHSNSIISAAYPSAVATKEAGYMGKKLLALLQMMKIDEPGTDCGSQRPIPITITDDNKSNQLFSYMVEGKELVLLDESNVKDYIGKTVLMRSPMSCLNDNICAVCAGELFYKLGVENAGLFAVQISHTALNLGLKAKHDQSVLLHQLDPDDIIIDI